MRRFIVLTLPVLAIAACTFDQTALDERRCEATEDCPAGPCVEGYCRFGDGSGGPDGSGEGCGVGGDCGAGLCVSDPAGEYCATRCASADDCGEDETCAPAAGTGGVSVCVPGGACVDPDGDGYGEGAGCAGPDCEPGDAAVHPGAEEICDAVDDDCDGDLDDIPRTECYEGPAVTRDRGECASGLARCEGGVPSCPNQVLPAEELCDNLDNDCDGQRDEELARTCYGGPIGTEDVGVCASGEQECVNGSWALCENARLPSPELCDGLDNDCDGENDDGWGVGDSCAEGVGECLREGVVACVGLSATECSVVAGEPEPEACDTVDNDCDGETDEPFFTWVETTDATVFGEDFRLNGHASLRDGFVRLTENADNQAGSVVFRRVVDTGEFAVEFDYRMQAGGGLLTRGADGMTFFWAPGTSPSLVGGPAENLGYSGIGGYAIELDTFRNGSYDPNDNHVALLSGTTATVVGVTEVGDDIRTSEWRRVTISRGAEWVTVEFDGEEVASFPADAIPAFSGYVGLTASTGGQNDEHDVRNFSMGCVP